jgi:hypothetical protein
MNHRFLPLAVLTTATLLAAQTSKVVPANRTGIEGSTTQAYPWSYSLVRYQQALASSAIAQTNAVVTQLAFRRDAGATTAFNAKSTTYQITLYETAIGPTTMTTTWAANRNGSPGTVVFNGALNIPASTITYPTPNAFALQIPLSTPFVYTVANGNLLLEVLGNDPADLFDPWRSDAEVAWTQARGDQVTVAPRCTGAGNESITLTPATASLVLGGNLSVATVTVPAGLPGVQWIGGSNQDWLGLPLPFDLAAAGAPGCNIGTGISALQASATSPVLWPIPGDSSLQDAVLFTQGLALAPGANAAQFVTSNTVQVRIGGPVLPVPVSQTVFVRTNIGNATGFMGAGNYLGSVIELTGAFN